MMEGFKKINWKATDLVLKLPNVRLHPPLHAAENADLHPNPFRGVGHWSAPLSLTEP